ncbi:MAG: YehR family lipoprotein, partial [Kluyvera sp.]
GVDVTSTVTYKGDKVLRQKSVSKIYYSTIGASTKQDAVSIIEPLREMYRNVAGLEESVKFEDSYAEEIVDVDLEKADLYALKKLMGAKISGDLSKGVSMKKTQEQLESMGFTEVK